MPAKKKGLTDQELIEKYEAGPVNVGAVVKKLMNTPPLPKKKKKTS